MIPSYFISIISSSASSLILITFIHKMHFLLILPALRLIYLFLIIIILILIVIILILFFLVLFLLIISF
jgi:hypothetical protein